jgi:hypothetical protein
MRAAGQRGAGGRDEAPAPPHLTASRPTLSECISVNHIAWSGPSMIRCITVFLVATL